MSTLWTPDGERPVPRAPSTPPPASQERGPGRQPGAGRDYPDGTEDSSSAELSPEEQMAQMNQLRDELSRIPPEVIVANHAYGLFELAAVHLSLQPPQLAQARTAIDAFAALVEGMAGRLGDAEAQLVDGLAQLRLTFVQVQSADHGG